MLKHPMPVLMAVILVAGLSGCDTQGWMSTVKSKMPPQTEQGKSALSPAYSQTGKVEANVLGTFGPPLAPKNRR